MHNSKVKIRQLIWLASIGMTLFLYAFSNLNSSKAQQNGVNQIAFTRGQTGSSQLYIVDENGEHAKALTKAPHDEEYYVTWSPDGSQFAYLAGNPIVGGRIYISNADGSKETPITSDFQKIYRDLAWSPDGKWIAYSNNSAMYLLSPDGSEDKLVTILHGTVSQEVGAHPSWSPDSNRLVFTDKDERTFDANLYIIDIDGSNKKQLGIATVGTDAFAAWSPDGKQIAFASERQLNTLFEIFVISADGSNVHQLTRQLGNDFQPAWSPDGKQIAFISARHVFEGQTPVDGIPIAASNTNYDLYVMDADGSNVQRLTKLSDSLSASFPQWKPYLASINATVEATTSVTSATEVSTTFNIGDVVYPIIPPGLSSIPLYFSPDPTQWRNTIPRGTWLSIIGQAQSVNGVTWWPVDLTGYQGWIPELSLSKKPLYQINQEIAVYSGGGAMQDAPNFTANVLEPYLAPNDLIYIVEGPRFDEGQIYWKVETKEGVQGWVTEDSFAPANLTLDNAVFDFVPGGILFTTSSKLTIPSGLYAYPGDPEADFIFPKGSYIQIVGGPAIVNNIEWWNVDYLLGIPRTDTETDIDDLSGDTAWMPRDALSKVPNYVSNQIAKIALDSTYINNIYKTSDGASSGYIETVKPGSTITIIGGPGFSPMFDVYWKIKAQNGLEGWILDRALESSITQASVTIITVNPTPTSDNPLAKEYKVNDIAYPNLSWDEVQIWINEEPKENSDQTFSILRGTWVTITGSAVETNGKLWLPIKLGNKQGWIDATNLSKQPLYSLGQNVIIKDQDTRVFNGPSSDNLNLEMTLTSGDVVSIVEGPVSVKEMYPRVYWKVQTSTGSVVWLLEAQLGRVTKTTEAIIATIPPTIVNGPTATADSVTTCLVITSNPTNLRRGPGTNYDVGGQLPANQSMSVIGLYTNQSGFVWYQLTNQFWVREDVVDIKGNCTNFSATTVDAQVKEIPSKSDILISRPNGQNAAQQFPSLWSLTKFRDIQSPDNLQYQILVNRNQTYRFSFSWCADSQARLEEILAPLSITFYVSGRVVDETQILKIDKGNCRNWYVLVSGWPSNKTTLLEIRYILTEDVFDGTSSYGAGTYSHQLNISAR